MSFSNLGMLGKWYGRTGRGTVIDRLARVRREGSPVYQWTVPVTATTATSVINVADHFPASRKYHPLDSIEIVNNETANDITVTINGGDARYCPAGTIRYIHGRGVALWHIAIRNDGAVNTTLGSIMVSLQKEPYTIDKWAGDS